MYIQPLVSETSSVMIIFRERSLTSYGKAAHMPRPDPLSSVWGARQKRSSMVHLCASFAPISSDSYSRSTLDGAQRFEANNMLNLRKDIFCAQGRMHYNVTIAPPRYGKSSPSTLNAATRYWRRCHLQVWEPGSQFMLIISFTTVFQAIYLRYK